MFDGDVDYLTPTKTRQGADPEGGEGAASTFSALLSEVRTVIEPAGIAGRRSLQLVLPPGSIVDAVVAQATLHAAVSAAARRDRHRAWTEALRALFVTQRGFLGDFDDPSSAARGP